MDIDKDDYERLLTSNRLYKELDRVQQIRLDRRKELNEALIIQIEAQVRVISRLEKQRDELLEALENMIEINDRHQEAWSNAKNAIAKAKGE